MYSPEEIHKIRSQPLAALMALALAAKLKHRGGQVSFCSILNAKSGKCSEDCRFCVQSGHFTTETPIYPLLGEEAVLAAAQEAKKIGASRFSLVTSGRGLSPAEVERAAAMIELIRTRIDIQVCASFGILNRPQLRRLRDAGLSRYHHNLESSREFFPRIVSTHTFDERIETIVAAQDAGLEVCAGGIFGLGEDEDDRLSLAFTLRELAVDSVPINLLIPLPGTPLAATPQLPVSEILRSIALFRLIHPGVALRLAAGRETVLRDALALAFMAGADGLMIGGYLTQKGRLPEEDHRFVAVMQEIWGA